MLYTQNWYSASMQTNPKLVILKTRLIANQSRRFLMRNHIPILAGMLVLALFLAFSFGLSKAQEANSSVERPNSPEEVAFRSSYIPIQGRLTDASGNPLNGNYDITLRLYDVSSGGTALCTNSIPMTGVHQGLFNAYMYGDSCSIDGRQLYLGIQVGTDPEMTPRQYIDNVPYAWSLRPGAVISYTLNNNAILHIENWSETGRGLRAYAMSTTGMNYGVIGASRSPDGYGGYFYNNNGGVGLAGMSYATSAPGVYAQGLDLGPDLILAGNAETSSGDDGRLSSDPAYPSSDLVFVSNDTIRLDLDNDANGEDADFEIYDRNNHNIFNVDESGTVTYGGAGIAAYPRPAYDSGWCAILQNNSLLMTHSLGGNVDNYVVDLTCKSGSGYGVNNFGHGGDYNYDEFYGAYWRSLTSATVTVFRMDDDLDCSQVRIRIWMYP
jgi:hypothetical protein